MENSTAVIPTIIHQSWKTTEIPAEVYPRLWQDSWRIHHPDWSYRLWTDADNEQLVRDHYPEFIHFYLTLNMGIKKADFCRFLYLHRFGGLYVDLDFIALKNHSALLDGASIVVGKLSEANRYYQIPNAFMASEPGLDFWLTIARDAMNAPLEEQSVERLSGPFRLELALNKYQPEGLRILESHLVYPFDWINFTQWEDGIHFRPGMADLAGSMKTMDLESIQAALPDSYAVTTWNHNW